MKHYGVILFNVMLVVNCSTSKNTRSDCHDKLTDKDHWVATTSGCLHVKTFRSKTVTENPNLVVVLHGDLNNPEYHYLLAERIASDNDNTIAVGILRPGYRDPEGNTSSGVRGRANGDNYTLEVINSIADAIKNLQAEYKPGKTMIAGHSGGAAITANVISLYPELANGAILVSCPCDVPAFRSHMKSLHGKLWDKPVTSLSPHLQTSKLNQNVKVLLIVGEKDDVTPIQLTTDYYDRLRQRHVDVRLVEVKDKSHNIFLEDQVRADINKFIPEVDRK